MSDEISLAVDYIYWFARPWGLCAAVYITASEHLVTHVPTYIMSGHNNNTIKKYSIQKFKLQFL